MRTFSQALHKALLGPYLREIESPKAPSSKQLIQGSLGVGGEPHGNPQGMWGALFGSMTPQGLRQSMEDDLIDSLTG